MNLMSMFFVEGEPRPKQSFRVSGKGGYQPARVKAWQRYVSYAAQDAMREIGRTNQPYEKAKLEVHLFFFLGNDRRVDLDNLSKAVLDGMNRIVFLDDQQIVDLRVSKELAKSNKEIGVRVEIYQAKREFCTCEEPKPQEHLNGYCKCGELIRTQKSKRKTAK